MNRRERRKLEREGKLPKSEPTYNMKPSAMVDSVMAGNGKEIMMAKIHEAQMQEFNKMTTDIDTAVLWCLHIRYGWGKVRLKRFYQALFEEHQKVRRCYEIGDLYPERMKLKEKGVDVEAWYNEFFDLEGNYKNELPVCDN